ncbi:MAG: hypothetical protein XD77_0325 [Marinimicrobia bacterium 46_47]|nr:MAG: hypothetical protein XD77_0325 [Marinimicrobia bacterium 46_47]KUK93438.1 MAG: hypothetical protein XE04_0228 [Marinimicrobia bacterium 46_43]
MKYRVSILVFLCIFWIGILRGEVDSYRPGPFYHRWNSIPGISFREPVFMTLFDVRFRGAFYASQGFQFEYEPQAITFDSTESRLDDLSNIWKRSLGTWDVNIFRYNWPYLFLKQNSLDFLTGIGIRETRALIPADLNPGWPNRVAYGRSFQFSPRIREMYISQTVYYQPFTWLLLHGEFTWGKGEGDLYTAGNKAFDVQVRGTGQSWSGGADWVFAPDRITGSRFRVGISFHRYSAHYDVKDSELFTPIQTVDLGAMGIELSFGILMGAQKSSGDEGISRLRSRDYVSASRSFDQYLRTHPRSLKSSLARQYKAYSDSMTYFQYYHEGDDFLKEGRIREARQRFDIAIHSGNMDLRQAVLLRQYLLAGLFVLEALNKLDQGDYLQADALIQEALHISPLIREDIREVISEIHLQKALRLILAGLYERAESYLLLAEQEFPSNKDRITRLRGEMAKAMLQDLKKAIKESDMVTARYFMEESGRIDRRSAELADMYANRIMEKLTLMENKLMQDTKEKTFEKLWMEAFGGAIPETAVKHIHIRVFETSEEIRQKMGDPQSVQKWNPGSPTDYMIWTYRLQTDNLYLYFHNHILMKIERFPRPD